MGAKDQRPVVWIHGSSGKMGKEIQGALLETSALLRLEGGSSTRFEGELFHQGQIVTPKLLSHSLARVDLILDFSSLEANRLLNKTFALGELRRKAILIGTTGLSEKDRKSWEAVAKKHQHRVLVAPNTSVGVLTLLKTALLAAGLCASKNFDVEIVETHHRAKVDAPSGTAMMLANSLTTVLPDSKVVTARSGARKKGELGVHSVRGGGVFGEHEIRFISDHEEVRLSHRAFSRALFAKGAVHLGQWLLQQTPGMYSLEDVDR